MRILYFKTFFLILNFHTVFSQTHPKIDSLLNVLQSSSEKLKPAILFQLSKAHLYDNPVKSNAYARKVIELSGEDANTEEIADAYRILGVNNGNLGNMDSSLYFYNRSLHVSVSIGDSIRIAKVYSAIAGYYRKLSDNPSMLKYILMAYSINDKIGYDYGVASNLLNIGTVYMDLKDYNKALEYFIKAEEANRKIGNASIEAVLYSNLGTVYSKLNNTEKRLEYHFKSLEAERKRGVSALASPYYNIGSVYFDLGQYDKAVYYLNESLTISKKFEKDLAAVTYKGLAEIYLKKKKYDSAKKYAAQALDLSTTIGFKNGMRQAYEVWRDITKATVNYKQVAFYQEKLMEVKDSIFNNEKSRQITALQTRYEVAQKEKAILLLEKEKKEKELINNIMIISFASAGIAGALFFLLIRLRMKKRQELHCAELKLQQNRIENALLREEELKKELEFKNREITSYTMNFVQKSELMEELKRNIQSISTSDADLSKKLSGLNKLIENSYQVDREWEDFKTQFENVHTNFFQQLKERCPELTNGDLKLCALLKLNMNMKEAAKVLGISPESVKTARYRLRKKFGLSQDDNLVDFILNIENANQEKLEVPA